MTWLPARRLWERLRAPDRLLALVAAAGTFAVVAVTAFRFGVPISSAGLGVLLGLFALDSAVRADPRRAFLPRRAARHRPRFVASLAIVTLALIALTVAIFLVVVGRGAVSGGMFVPLAFIVAVLLGLCFWVTQLPPPPSSMRCRPIWPLLTTVSADLAPPPSQLYASQARVRRLLAPSSLVVLVLVNEVAPFAGTVGTVFALVTLGAVALALLWLVGAEVVAVATGASPTSPWRARSWYDDHFTRPERYRFPAARDSGDLSVHVADSCLWLTITGGCRMLPFWPRRGEGFADGAAEVLVAPGFSGAVGVAARVRRGSFGRMAGYLGWLEDGGRAGIAIQEFGRRPVALITAGAAAPGAATAGAALRLLCVGAELRLAVDGRVVAAVGDARLGAGRWGLFIGATPAAPANAALDALSIVEVVRDQPTAGTVARPVAPMPAS